MKIGILTFHRAYNYGAILQAYALQKKLTELGIDSEIIDYLSVAKSLKNKLFTFKKERSIKTNLIEFVKDIYRKTKNESFDRFMQQEMTLSKCKYSTIDELRLMDKDGIYDTYIVGSDQVWNYKNTLNDSAFLLNFVNDDRKKCSYAASIGSAKFDADLCKQYNCALKKFRVLTVREESAIENNDFLRENKARVVVDPTLLLEKSTYEKISNHRIIGKKYAFIYTIAGDRNLRKYAKKFCDENSLILVDCKNSPVFFKNSSPRDFLSFVQNAEYVFTNSFHGTAFSIIMEKQFVTELQTKTSLNNRSRDLMANVGLLDRDMDSANFDINKKIDYNQVHMYVDEMRTTSINILQEITTLR